MTTSPSGSAFYISRICAAVAMAAVAFATAASAQDDSPAWEKLLRIQLEDSHKCVLSGTLFVREMPVTDGIAYSGRAKCFDGREYDFSQSKPHMKFEIKSCDPTFC
ncbi:MAG: hypothetical protein WBP38_11110 [Hyphomicrobium sp.]